MAVVDIVTTLGTSYVLNAVDEWIGWVEPGTDSGIVIIALEFNGAWSGTVEFEGGVRIDNAFVSDPILATNMNTGATATTSVGGASAVEFWRVDLAGGNAVRVYCTVFAAGQVEVTFRITRG